MNERKIKEDETQSDEVLMAYIYMEEGQAVRGMESEC